MRYRLSLGLLAALLTALPAGALRLEPFPIGEETPQWDGPQFVQADRAGNVYFLRASTLQVYAMTKKGTLGEPARLASNVTAGGTVRNAVMSPGGNRWLLLTGLSVRLFADGKEILLPPLPWKPWSVGMLRDTPVIGVMPTPLGAHVDLDKIGTPPWFLRLDRERWSSDRDLKGVDVAELVRNGNLNDAVAEHAVFLAGDRQGKLWAARHYSYRVQRFGSGVRPLLEITVDGGKARPKKEDKGIEIELSGGSRNPREATQNPRTEKGTFYAFTEKPVLLALTEGRDGRMYFLVRTDTGGAALDRYDPVRSVLERTSLQIKAEGGFTLAAGRDALYLAAWDGKAGRWRVSWDALEQANWKEVENARIDGLDAETEEAAASLP